MAAPPSSLHDSSSVLVKHCVMQGGSQPDCLDHVSVILAVKAEKSSQHNFNLKF